jgi:photosystem II stability/assembly factor-like uncharacterized protein
MRIKVSVIFFVLILSFFIISNIFCLPSYNPRWKDYNRGIKELDARYLVSSPKDNNVLFAATNHAVYKTEDAGGFWKEIFSPGGSVEINYLCINSDNPFQIYAATGKGLYFSNDSGKKWQKIFTGSGKEEECLLVKLHRGIIFLGTGETLFLSFDSGKTWVRQAAIPLQSEIIDVAYENNEVYVVTDKGIYRTDSQAKEWQIILVSFGNEKQEEDNNGEGVTDEDSFVKGRINRIAIDPRNSARIFLGTNNGILASNDRGKSWANFSSSGIFENEIKDILISPVNGRQYAATKRGVYWLVENRWQQLYLGLITEEINRVQEDIQGRIWLASKGGIYKLATEDAAPIVSSGQEGKALSFEDEPTIQELQGVAVSYAEVAPEKIKNWRRQAQMKAIMPEVSVDFDRTVTTALGATYDKTAVGPQDWGVNLKWNIGELVWNNDQTSIDSRSKLMVELRDDIINELTRLYFERRRLQVEMVSLPPSASEKSEKELRIQELTALIDGLTGGYLSESLNKNKI